MPNRAKTIDKSSSIGLARILLAAVVLALTPLMRLNIQQSKFSLLLSPLEVTVIVVSKYSLPAVASDFLQTLLLPGSYLRLAYQECSRKDSECNWYDPVPISKVWASLDLGSDEWQAKSQAWAAATGRYHVLMSSASVAVTLGGIACLVYPVKMTFVSCLVLTFGSWICGPNGLSTLPTMLFVLLLSFLLFLGDRRAPLLKRRREIDRDWRTMSNNLPNSASVLGMKLGTGGGADRKAKSVKGRMKKFL